MPAAFSRLQLAAALLEYDNDPDNPDAPRRSAKESAIFAHLRRNPAAPVGSHSRKSDYIGVSLPHDTTSAGGRGSVLDARRSRTSRASFDALRNPFNRETIIDDGIDEQDGDELEVDLTSWGLDSFMPKESKKGKGKQVEPVADPPINSVPTRQPFTRRNSTLTSPNRALSTSRSMSVGGNLDFFGQPISERHPTLKNGARRRSFGSPLELAAMEPIGPPLQRPRAVSQSFATSPPTQPIPQSIPFPSVSVRSVSPAPADMTPHERRYSMASMSSKILMEGIAEEDRIDHTTSEPNPFELRPPTHVSRFDPKAVAHARTISNASMGSRMLLDNDEVAVVEEQPRRERRYSTTLDLLRPKVLVMPSPLQQTQPQTDTPQRDLRVGDGFQLSTDGPPLPPGARSSRKTSFTMTPGNPDTPAASNLFTPNPLLDLSLSQKTFRSTLVFGADNSNLLPRATLDGEQIQLDPSIKIEDIPDPALEELPSKQSRPAGKLYGKSLIDDLENRKAQMRNKQRVFTGDDRPSMMARNQQRSSTLLDPASLHVRPGAERMSSYGSSGQRSALQQRGSLYAKPLLNFEDDDRLPQPVPPGRLPSSRSVFGVDTLWEREMAKLREIQTQEHIVEEERRNNEVYDDKGKDRKKKRKGKGKGKDKNRLDIPETNMSTSPIIIPAEPPMLPDIKRAPRRVPAANQNSDGTDSGDSDAEPTANRAPQSDTWHVYSSDEEGKGPRRTTGVGLRYPKPRIVSNVASPDSDEDVPLAVALNRITQPSVPSPAVDPDSEDEEKPLAALLHKTKSTTSNLLTPAIRRDDDDDDDQPLGLRSSRLHIPAADDDDDQPLAYHPEQQRRTQYQMMAQHQQQMMMQTQLQSSMFFSPPVMGPGFFSPPMMNPMMAMQPPMPIPSPPPIRDEAKFGRVDRWRRGVAVEGNE